jgi:hypothetical protein
MQRIFARSSRAAKRNRHRHRSARVHEEVADFAAQLPHLALRRQRIAFVAIFFFAKRSYSDSNSTMPMRREWRALKRLAGS